MSESASTTSLVEPLSLAQRPEEDLLDGEPAPVVGFYGSKGTYGCFSNWHPSCFTFLGKRFATSEQYMMWEKARVFGDVPSEQKILCARTPKEAKALGRKVSGFDPDLWSSVCRPLMVCGLRQKFLQNPAAMDVLLSTGSATIAEASPTDSIWGIGLGPDDPLVSDPSAWRGTNFLGQVLMQTRSDLRMLLQSGVTHRDWSTDDQLKSNAGGLSLSLLLTCDETAAMARAYELVCSRMLGSRPRSQASLAMLSEEGCACPGFDELLDEVAFWQHLGKLHLR